ncbi:unnamed protein product [Prorocentrum cordatum]|uniref:Uncharacterized protein n=1 Tax=Prorocentrum cordatum TaxID=2364126 RepID=A0ABN9TT95_9DINO|nr:unnamed protein product [Polarella glacialis]
MSPPAGKTFASVMASAAVERWLRPMKTKGAASGLLLRVCATFWRVQSRQHLVDAPTRPVGAEVRLRADGAMAVRLTIAQLRDIRNEAPPLVAFAAAKWIASGWTGAARVVAIHGHAPDLAARGVRLAAAEILRAGDGGPPGLREAAARGARPAARAVPTSPRRPGGRRLAAAAIGCTGTDERGLGQEWGPGGVRPSARVRALRAAGASVCCLAPAGRPAQLAPARRGPPLPADSGRAARARQPAPARPRGLAARRAGGAAAAGGARGQADFWGLAETALAGKGVRRGGVGLRRFWDFVDHNAELRPLPPEHAKRGQKHNPSPVLSGDPPRAVPQPPPLRGPDGVAGRPLRGAAQRALGAAVRGVPRPGRRGLERAQPARVRPAERLLHGAKPRSPKNNRLHKHICMRGCFLFF